MNGKNIKKALNNKVKEWIESINDDNVKKLVRENAIISGGAIVSLLTNEKPNDYDIYLRTREAALKVAEYYVNRFNIMHGTNIYIEEEKTESGKVVANGKISVVVRSSGIASENTSSDEISHNFETDEENTLTNTEDYETKKKRYRPIYITSNALTLSDKIQIVIRFWGEVKEIHKNYDFVHCTCSYDYRYNKPELPSSALERIINKELYYIGSKYPLCSIIRARKFINRGYTIDAGQYLKMCLQLNDLNLHDISTLKDQLIGVDSAYFNMAIEAIEKKKENDPQWKVDNSYLFEVINRIF